MLVAYLIMFLNIVFVLYDNNTALQSQKVKTAYLKWNQLLPFCFAHKNICSSPGSAAFNCDT